MTTHPTRFDAPGDVAYPPGLTIVRRSAMERIPWRGIFAGAFVAVALQTLLMLLGVGIGLVSVDSIENMDGVALGTGIWWIIAGTVAIFLGAWVAGRLTVPRDYLDGAITGAVTWALLTVASLWMAAASAGAAIGGAYAVTADAAQAALRGDNPRAALSDAARSAGVSDAAGAAQSGALDDADLAVNRAEAERAAAAASDVVGEAALWTGFMLVLGLAAGCAGGALGVPDRDRTALAERTVTVPASTSPHG